MYLNRCLCESARVAEVLRERERGRLADVADAERIQEARQSRALGGLHGHVNLLRRFFTHALERLELRGFELEQIGGGLDPIAIHQLLDQLVAETLDIERAPRCEVLDLLFALRRT